MAKQRFRADLYETMMSAQSIIDSANNTQQANETAEEEQPIESSQKTISQHPSEKAEKKAPVSTQGRGEESGAGSRGPKSGTVGKGHVINANLGEETFWRANAVKMKLNKQRTSKEDSFVSINTLLCTALEFWLDNKYPETKEQYKLLQEMGMI